MTCCSTPVGATYFRSLLRVQWFQQRRFYRLYFRLFWLFSFLSVHQSVDFTKKLRSLVCVFNLPHIRFHVHVIYSLPLTYMYLHTYFSIYPVWIAIYTWHLIYKCGAGSPLPHFFSFHFSVFSDAMLRVSCEILWECGPVNLLGSVWPNSLLNPPYVEPKQKLLESPRFHWIK